MDDQNQNNQPLDQGTVPVDPMTPSVPLDITPPVEAPVAQIPTPPTEVPPVVPLTVPEPVSIPDVPAFSVPLPEALPPKETDVLTPTDSPMPTGKPKNKIMPIIGGVVALLLVVGMAGAAYYVSNQLSTRQAIAPNAPESKPLATTCNATTEFTCSCSCGTFCLPGNATYGCAIECVNQCGGTPNYTTPPLTATPSTQSTDSCGSGKTCSLYSTLELCTGPGGISGACTKATGGSGNCCAPNNIPTTTQLLPVGSNCVEDSVCSSGYCNRTTGWCENITNYPTCGTGLSCSVERLSGIGNPCLNGNVKEFCCAAGWYISGASCVQTTVGNGGPCDVNPITQASVNTPVCSGTQCIQYGWKEGSNGVACYKTASGCPNNCVTTTVTATITATITQAACINYTYIPNATSAQENQIICNPDKSKLGTINFTNAGDVRIHLNGVSAGTTVSLTKGGASATVTKIDDNNFDATVQTGTYNIVIKLGSESTNSLGFIKPANGVCVRYGAPEDISSKITSAALTGYGIISTAGVDSPIQCWGDTIQGNDTNQRGQLDANYDFNDFNVEIGYKSTQTVVGACTLISIYKKVDGVYGTTPLTTEDLQALKVGDVLKFSLSSNNDNLKGRFGVTLNSGTVVWMSGVIDDTNKRLITYSDYTVATAGTYKFEAQVTKVP